MKKYVIIKIRNYRKGNGMLKQYVLSVKIVESGMPFIPVIVLQTDDRNSILNLIGAANATLEKVVIGADGLRVNDFGEIERDRHNIHLHSCVWQYFENLNAYIGYIEGDEDFPVNIFTCLKEKKI